MEIARPTDCYQVETHVFTGRPRKKSTIGLGATSVDLQNLRPFPDWQGGRGLGTSLETNRIFNAIRDGDGHTGRPEGYEQWRDGTATLEQYQVQAALITMLTLAAPRQLWLAYSERGVAGRMLPIARLAGVELDMSYEPRFIPIIETKLGELALVPPTYHEGWLHVETA